MICRAGRVVLSCRRIGRWRWCNDQLFGMRDIGLAGGAGEQFVVADAKKSPWSGVE
jgi:hypothetical protein